EVVRFGPEKLRVIKELDPETLDLIVPSMLLQPLVENSIKHGLSPKIGGGSIVLRSRMQNERVIIEIEDDGVGMLAEEAVMRQREFEKNGDDPGWVQLSGGGIGMHNVAERLEVLYGRNGRMQVYSRKGSGTRVTLELPLLHSDANQQSAATAI